ILEGLSKLVFGTLLVTLGYGLNGAILTFPLSAFMACLPLQLSKKTKNLVVKNRTSQLQLNIKSEIKTYYKFSLISSLGLMILSSMDVLTVKHLLSPQSAGTYSLLTIFGKIILFGSTA